MDIFNLIKSDSKIPIEQKNSAIEEIWTNADKYVAEQSLIFEQEQTRPDEELRKRFFKEKSHQKIDGAQALLVAQIYIDHKYLNDPEIINKLITTFKFKKHELVYFTPKEIIEKEITRLNQTTIIRVNPAVFFKLIEYHFAYKIFNTVLLHFGIVAKRKSGKEYNQIHATLYTMYRNLLNSISEKSSNKKLIKYMDFMELTHPFEHSNKTLWEGWKILLDETQGKTEKTIIKELLEQAFYFRCSKRKFYQEIFPLMKLILPDQSLLSKDEFLQNSLQSQSFNADYRQYQAFKIRSIIK